ncbi:MAG: winged helix-turn-helix transcriptional regulator [Nanoarchaeota archaeon]|nr:winged helix-turn-helix transcriptional regulator [Nanoarchaeota archaeon]
MRNKKRELKRGRNFYRTERATPQATPQAELTELENKIVDEIKKNIKISRKELADILNISSDTIKEYLGKLKLKKIIKRIGETSAGYWQIIGENKEVKNEK